MKKKIYFILNFKEKLSRILMLLIVFLLCLYSDLSIVQAGADVSQVVSDIQSNPDPLYQTIRQIIVVLSGAGSLIAALKIGQIGITMMMGGTSSKLKNEAKSAMLPWAVGFAICMTFGTIGPWAISLIIDGNTGGVFDI